MSRVAFSLALCLVGIALTIAAPRPEEQQQQQQQQNFLQGISIPGGFQVPNIPGFPGANAGSGAPTLDINTLSSYNEYLTQYISAFQNQTANIPVIGGGGSGKEI